MVRIADMGDRNTREACSFLVAATRLRLIIVLRAILLHPTHLIRQRNRLRKEIRLRF